jgi:PhnB protein
LAFYRDAFGATELVRMDHPDGRLGHAEIQIGDSRVMLADEFPEMGAKSPATLGGSGVHLVLYVNDADASFAQAVRCGGKITRPIKDQFYGDRSGTIEDPFGHSWTIGTHKEDLTGEEMERRRVAAEKGA